MLAHTFALRSAFVLLLAVASSPAHAARIYRLVDYPDLQNGHALTGTITTSDDAPADGMLNTAEILNWQWSTAGANTLSASYVPPIPGLPTTFAQGIAITPTRVVMPRMASVRMSLEEAADRGHGRLAPAMRWFTYFDDSQGTYEFRSLAYVVIGGDVPMTIWSSELVGAGDDDWLIATVIPEPASIWLVIVLLLCNSMHSFQSFDRSRQRQFASNIRSR